MSELMHDLAGLHLIAKAESKRSSVPWPAALEPIFVAVTRSPAERSTLAGHPHRIWAWVELNYRPHAYQTETERWPALLAVDSAKLTRYVADWRWLALTRFVTTDDTTATPLPTKRALA